MYFVLLRRLPSLHGILAAFDLPLPFFSISQNLEGLVASPGKRQAMPTTAMGKLGSIFVTEPIVEQTNFDIR